MTTDKANKSINIKVGNEAAEQVTSYKYLGYTIDNGCTDNKAINERIGLGWAAFKKKKPILTKKTCSMRVKKNIVECFIYPVVTYGLDCATWNKMNVKKVNVFQNDLMRIIYNKTLLDKVTIETLKEKTGLRSIFEDIKRNKINLFRKVKEKEAGVAKTCMEGNIEGKRSRGRPSRRWLDDINSWTQKPN